MKTINLSDLRPLRMASKAMLFVYRDGESYWASRKVANRILIAQCNGEDLYVFVDERGDKPNWLMVPLAF